MEKQRYVAVAPSELPDEHLAKDTKMLRCPFCGSQFEITDYEAYNERCKTRKWRSVNMICQKTEIKVPIALKCDGCGIEIRNLCLFGWFYDERVKDK